MSAARNSLQITYKVKSAPEHAVLNLAYPSETKSLMEQNDLEHFSISLSLSSYGIP